MGLATATKLNLNSHDGKFLIKKLKIKITLEVNEMENFCLFVCFLFGINNVANE